MKRSLFLLLVVLLAGSGCGPLIELEDENVALKARIDSLEIALADCGTQTDLAHERLSAIERENLQLDDRNRQLAARIAEAEYGGAPERERPAAPPADHGETSAAVPATIADPPHGTLASSDENEINASSGARDSGTAVPAYDPAKRPDLDFLREYQAGLSAYNARQYDRARKYFAGLLQTGTPNEMTDNCVYWLGETALQQGQYAEAHELFTIVLGYKQTDKAAQALLSRARAASALGRTKDARTDCENLLRAYPGSDQAALARDVLRKLP